MSTIKFSLYTRSSEHPHYIERPSLPDLHLETRQTLAKMLFYPVNAAEFLCEL